LITAIDTSFRCRYLHSNLITDWNVTESEFAQIQALAAFTADAAPAGASCEDGAWETAHGVKFCVLGANTQAADTPSPVGSDGSDSDSGGLPYLVYWVIGGVVLVLLLLLVLVWQRRSHRSRRHSDIANTPMGDANAAFAPSPAVAAAMRASSNQALAPGAGVGSGSVEGPASGAAVPVAGVAAAGAGGAMVAAMGAFSRKNSNNNNNGEDYTHDALKAQLLSNPQLAATRIPGSDLKLGRCISRGGFGLVFVGDLRGRQVAVKKIRNDRTVETEQIEQFIREISLIATLHHPRIVEFIGVSWETSLADLAAVTELMERGDLRNVTRGFKRRGYRLTWEAHKMRIALHVAQALEYLHSRTPAVVHRDLKAKNVLLNVEMEAKLSDFGIARERPDEAMQMMTAGIGTSFWIAPEVLMGRDYDERADIYSFGVVLSELDTDDYPYWNASNPPQGKAQENEILRQVAAGDRRPAFSSDCPASVLSLAARCLQAEPSDRPSAAELVVLLQKLEREGSASESTTTTTTAAGTAAPSRESTYIITTRSSMPSTEYPANRASYSRVQSALSRSGSGRPSMSSPPTVRPAAAAAAGGATTVTKTTTTTSTVSGATKPPVRREVTSSRVIVTGDPREVVVPPRPSVAGAPGTVVTRTVTSSTRALPPRAGRQTTTTTTRTVAVRPDNATASQQQQQTSVARETSTSERSDGSDTEEQKSGSQAEYKWILY
jgi:serine/threonine protein kinase